MKRLTLVFLPAYSILFTSALVLGMTGCSPGADEASADVSSRDGRNNLTIDRARIEENRLEVEGTTPGEEDNVDIRILDDLGNVVLSVGREAEDNEYRLRRRPAPVPSCIAEVSSNGSTVTRAVDNRPVVPNVGKSSVHTILITSPNIDIDRKIREEQINRIEKARRSDCG